MNSTINKDEKMIVEGLSAILNSIFEIFSEASSSMLIEARSSPINIIIIL
ncbi:hypothetical protein [Clostridium sp. LP20]